VNSKHVKIGIIAVALGTAALLLMFRSNVAEPVPDTPETAVAYQCRICKTVFNLTPTQVKAEVDRAGQDVPLHCQSCSEKEAYRVATCDKCNGQYFGPEVPGSTGACPQCFPATVAPRVVIQAEEEKVEAAAEEVQDEGPPKPRVVPNF